MPSMPMSNKLCTAFVPLSNPSLFIPKPPAGTCLRITTPLRHASFLPKRASPSMLDEHDGPSLPPPPTLQDHTSVPASIPHTHRESTGAATAVLLSSTDHEEAHLDSRTDANDTSVLNASEDSGDSAGNRPSCEDDPLTSSYPSDSVSHKQNQQTEALKHTSTSCVQPSNDGAWKQPPGPFPLPVVGNALDFVDVGIADLMLTYSKKYGRVVRFSILSDVSYLITDPDAIAYVTTQNSKNYLDRWTPPGFGDLLYQGQLRGLVFSQGKQWMQHRQIVGKAFRSPAFAKAFFSTVLAKTAYLMDTCWEAGGKVGQTINVHQEMRKLTLDIIGKAAFDVEFETMRNGGHEIESRLSNVLNSVLGIIKNPIPLWRFMRTPGRASVEKDLKRLQEIELELLHSRRKRFIAEQTASQSQSSHAFLGSSPVSVRNVDDASSSRSDSAGSSQMEPEVSDFLGLLLKARDSFENRALHFTDEDLMWDIHDIIFAGHETTASALGAALFQIAGSPRVLSQIQQELDTVLKDGRVLSFEDLEKLEYMDMVFNESLRLVPPTALVGRISKEADVVAGYHIPEGSSVLMSPYAMGHLEQFWENPESFIPERFSKESRAARNPMIHTPFGAGPRICLGARLATLEAKAVLAITLSRYTFQRTQDRLVCNYNSTVSFKSGMDMVLRRR